MFFSASTITLYDILQVAMLIGIGCLIYIVSKSLPAYLIKKGENLATKEDLQGLTEIAERIRSQFSQANTVHKVQFEAEFQAYQELWSAAHKAFVAHLRWQSLSFQTGQAEFQAFAAAHIPFADCVVRFQPFIPESVWNEFKALDEVFVDAKIDHTPGVTDTPSTRTAQREAIGQAKQKCVAAVRKRLSEVLVV
jgi:hypothetical protein